MFFLFHNFKTKTLITMKKKILFFFISSTLMIHAQQKIHFDYDSAGNQINRVYCLSCGAKTQNVKDFAVLKDSDMQKFHPDDEFMYYPNPVKEILYLKWKITNTSVIEGIKLFNINGLLIKEYNDLKDINNQSILFQDYPIGLYILELTYDNGEQKTVKIIKE